MTEYERGFRDALERAIRVVSTNLPEPVSGAHAVVLMRACERIESLKAPKDRQDG